MFELPTSFKTLPDLLPQSRVRSRYMGAQPNGYGDEDEVGTSPRETREGHESAEEKPRKMNTEGKCTLRPSHATTIFSLFIPFARCPKVMYQIRITELTMRLNRWQKASHSVISRSTRSFSPPLSPDVSYLSTKVLRVLNNL